MKKEHHRYRILPYITIILLVTSVMCLLNFQLFTYSLNTGYYDTVEADITSESFDGLMSLIPKLGVEYSYDGESYKTSFLFYNTWIFLHRNLGSSVDIKVNNQSPKDIIYVHSFWDSYVNIALVIINIVCTFMIINNVRRFIPQYVREKVTRRARKEAKRRVKVSKKEEKEGGDI